MDSIKNTVFIGKVLNHFDELPSTNAYASELLLQPALKLPNLQNTCLTDRNTCLPDKQAEGVVVSTFNQTFGRGQMGTRWESEPYQNLAVSIIFRPTFLQARQQFHLNKAVALAVTDFVAEQCGVKTNCGESKVCIKWANDIYVNDRKIAGILIQNTLSGADIQSTIVGIGLNVNQIQFNNIPNATSLKLETGKDFVLTDMLEKLCQCVEKRYLQLKTLRFDALHTQYLDKLFRINVDAVYQYPNGNFFTGKIVGVGDNGKLMIMTKTGIENFDIKEVRFVI